jgi:hypothetical protein
VGPCRLLFDPGDQALGLLAMQAHLVRQGFKVTEVSGRFDANDEIEE